MKTLYLLRGLPGAGKSTLASQLADSHFEADMYFTNENGQYLFNPSEIKKAHAWCQSEVHTAMILNHTTGDNEKIVVSNTFTQGWEMEPYYKLAESYGYRVFSIIVENRHGGENQHGVPEDKIEEMRVRFEFRL
jgi:predicted kinase